MKTKTVEATETVQPTAAKPLNKPAATPGPVVKKVKPEIKSAEPEKVVKTVTPKPVVKKLNPEVKAAEPAKETKHDPKVAKKPKLKVVRDSFTMPQNEYMKISEIKELCLKAGMPVKKSEVLRAGVIALSAMNEKQLQAALSGLDKIKTGRPNKP